MTTLSQSTLLMLRDKNIVVLGIGLTGLSCVRFLHANNISFAINDSRKQPIEDIDSFYQNYPETKLVLGHWDAELISAAQVLLVSPGIDLSNEIITDALSPDCLVIGDVELYCQLTNTPILAVTGSNGKSTVVSLVAHLGQSLGYHAVLGGNIGIPVLDHLVDEAAKPIDMLVLELSSFQLESLNNMDAIAATVLNISDDHLDRHLTMENYTRIKQHIYAQCQSAVINRDDPYTVNTQDKLQQKTLSFGSDKPQIGHFGIEAFAQQSFLMFGEQKLIALDNLPIAGIHNALNCLAALALGFCAGWSLDDMVNNLASFGGLAHRCQRVASNDNIIWVNDSKATNVGATLAAINGLAQTMSPAQQLILIAGGEGKGADFSPLKTAIKRHVKHLITLGKDGSEIAKLTEHNTEVLTLEQAVQLASQMAADNDVVLLSPACASLDMFKNFAERGNSFINAVHKLEGRH